MMRQGLLHSLLVCGVAVPSPMVAQFLLRSAIMVTNAFAASQSLRASPRQSPGTGNPCITMVSAQTPASRIPPILVSPQTDCQFLSRSIVSTAFAASHCLRDGSRLWEALTWAARAMQMAGERMHFSILPLASPPSRRISRQGTRKSSTLLTR